jgi:signal peptidase I
MLFAVAVGIAFVAFCISDAISIAKRKKENYEPTKCNRWFAYVGYVVMVALFNDVYAFTIIIPFFVEAYKMPSGSMKPTLLIGDHFIVNKLIYKITVPRRGDVFVSKYPGNPTEGYLKRLIGQPGDEVEILGRLVLINGKPLEENYVQYIIPESVYDHFGPYRVPPENYFVLGDNRDNSMDSRFIGFVPREYLLGKPLFIYWSFQPTSIDDPDRVESIVRWRRIFRIIK